MATLNFTVAYSSTLAGLEGQTPSITIFAEDLGLCQSCIDQTNSCWACLQTTQQVFNDGALSSPVADGYYMVKYSEESNPAVWHIQGGYPQSEGFFN
jgi:hypothetical protein